MSGREQADFVLDDAQLNALYQYAMALCLQADDAYDLLQSCLESYLVQVRCKPGTIDRPEAYLRTLIRNRFIDHYRRRQRWQTDSFEESASYDISPVDLEQTCIDADQLGRIWQVLAPIERDILYHWAVLGYSTDETCAQLGMPRGTLLARIHRLRKKLRTPGGEPERLEGT